MNQILESTTKEEVNNAYKTYPSVNGSLTEKPFYESRYAPIFFEIPMGSKVLDCGCNDGIFMEMLRDKRGCDVIGIDMSETALNEARKKGLNVQIADVENLPFADGTFDVVLSMELLSHLYDPEKALSEMKRVLKKRGFLLGSCPHSNLEKFAWDDKRLHRRYYDLQELHQLLERHFDKNWINVLNGGQFSFSLSESFLANLPVEMLFKCGRDSTKGWDEALQDRSVLRCWMGFTQGPGVAYYRMSGFADKMQKMGAQVHYDPYNENDFNSTSGWCQKIRYSPSENRFINAHIVHELEALLKASDMSVFQITSSRDILLFLTTARLGVIKKPLITELDDWIFDMTSFNSASGAYHPNSEPEAVAYDQIKLSDAFIVSTEYLREKLRTLTDKPIYVVKNSLDFEIWDKVEKKRPSHEANPDLIRIGYTGCQNHSGDIGIIKKPLLALLEEFQNLEFLSLSHKSTDDIENPRYKRIADWVPLSVYPQSISNWEMDIGIAPLQDHELNRAKSNLRWLEYSALKIPTIASSIEPFTKSIENKKTGILVSNSQKEWYEAMRDLVLDREKRERIGEASYKEVKKNYNMDNVAKEYLSVLKHIKNDFIRGKK